MSVFRAVYFIGFILLTTVAQEKIQIGLFFDEDKPEIKFWNDAVLLDNFEEGIETNETFIEKTVSSSDIFGAFRILCNYTESAQNTRIVGLFAPGSSAVSSVLESISSHLKIPYFITSWRSRAEQQHENVFNLYPNADLLAKGIAKVIESFDWPSFIILYEDDDGLLRLQEVLKLKEHKADNKKNEIIIYKLSPTEDNRNVFKNVKASSHSKIILDCHVDRIMDYLRQAQEVGLLAEFSRSIYLSSLDAHTLEFASLKTPINITTARIYNPFSINFQNLVLKYFSKTTAPKEIRLEEALILDATLIIIQGINEMLLKKIKFPPIELKCDSNIDDDDASLPDDDLGLIEVFQNTKLIDGLTGSILLNNGIRDEFILEVIEVDKPERSIGIWNANNPENIILTRNATEREAELQRRMESHNFIVTSRVGPPYLFERTKGDGYKNNRYYGYSMDLITEIAKLMNITFEFRITEKNSYPNLVADLVERRADLGICDFTITPQRREIIDFSMPFMNLGIGILHKAVTQEQADNMYAFMRPISWTVWFYMWTLSLVSSTIMFFVARMAPAEWENPKPWDPESKELENIWDIKNFWWLILGSITAQGCDILPKSSSTRVVAASYWFFSLIIMSSYTANLAAFLTMQKRDITIDSVEELGNQIKVKYGLMEKGSTELFFSTSKNPLYQKMWNTMANEKPSVFEKDNPSGVERVLSTKNGLYAYFMESTGIEYELERKCDLRKVGGLLDSKSYGIGMPLNADYRHTINSAVLNLQESGKLMALKARWWKENREGEPCERSVEEQSDALALSNVGGIFIVLSVGIGLAYIIAIIEFLWNIRQISIEEHISFIEALKCELKFACKIFTRKKRAKTEPSESSGSSSSIKTAADREKMSVARSIFSKSVSLMNYENNPENPAPIRRRKSIRRDSLKTISNHFSVRQ